MWAGLQVFTKCMAVIMAFLRRQGVQVYLYLDDWLVRCQTRAQVESSIHLIHLTFRDLGLLINMQKSTLASIQRIEFIVAVLASVQARTFLPEWCFLAIVELIACLKDHPMMMAQSCLGLLGLMATCTSTWFYQSL